jgi:hypothetical protein
MTLAEICGSKDGKGYQARDGSVEIQRMVRAFLAVNADFAD